MLPNIHSQQDDILNCAMFTKIEYYTAMKTSEIHLYSARITQKQFQVKKNCIRQHRIYYFYLAQNLAKANQVHIVQKYMLRVTIMNILKTEIVKAKFITMTTLEGTRRYKNLEEHISEFRTNGGAPLLKFMGFLFHFYLEDNYNIVMVSATYHHESAIGIHTSPPSGTSLPTPPLCYHSFPCVRQQIPSDCLFYI